MKSFFESLKEHVKYNDEWNRIVQKFSIETWMEFDIANKWLQNYSCQFTNSNLLNAHYALVFYMTHKRLPPQPNETWRFD